MTSRAPGASAFAAAKVNLFLHVGPLGADGYHPIASLFVFADIGDRLSLGAGASGRLTIEGQFGTGLSAGADNLVARAREALSPGMATDLVLVKALPLAAGIGGGSADAAATVRLLNPLLPQPRSEAALMAIAAGLGADVAACLESRAVIATGRGEQLSPAPRLPELHAVLANPGVEVADRAGLGVALSTRLDRRPQTAACPAMRGAASCDAARRSHDLIDRTRNDLEAPALNLASRPRSGRRWTRFAARRKRSPRACPGPARRALRFVGTPPRPRSWPGGWRRRIQRWWVPRLSPRRALDCEDKKRGPLRGPRSTTHTLKLREGRGARPKASPGTLCLRLDRFAVEVDVETH